LVNAKSYLVKAKSILANAEEREQALRSLLATGAARFDYLDAQARVIQAQAGVTGSEDGITNAQTKVLEAADKVTSIEKTLP